MITSALKTWFSDMVFDVTYDASGEVFSGQSRI